MSEARAAVATTGTGANRPACPGELDDFDCAFPDWTRATYALTPALSGWVAVNPTWAAEKVDTNTSTTRAHITGPIEGDSSYIGTESSIGFTWKFAPNVAFDWSGAYLAAGKALDTSELLNNVLVKRKADDAYLTSARLRLSF